MIHVKLDEIPNLQIDGKSINDTEIEVDYDFNKKVFDKAPESAHGHLIPNVVHQTFTCAGKNLLKTLKGLPGIHEAPAGMEYSPKYYAQRIKRIFSEKTKPYWQIIGSYWTKVRGKDCFCEISIWIKPK